MKFIRSILLLFILSVCQTTTTIASPAYPGLISIIQPDGAEISVYLKGDEKVRWMESEDGYTLMYDAKKFIVYAEQDANNNMVPSKRQFSDTSIAPNGIKKGLFYSASQVKMLKQIWNITQQPSSLVSSRLRSGTEKRYIMCALVEFQNESFTFSWEDFNQLMNQAGYSVNRAQGSVNEYYLENSYGKLDLTVTVSGIYKLSKNYDYYGANDPSTGQEYPERVREFAREAANFAFNDSINSLDKYDYDNDGFIDAFHIIYAGYGEEAGASPDRIWAHAFGFSAIKFGNKSLNCYSCSPELQGKSGKTITNVGVICHEMCHIFGSPDFYDTDGTDSGGEFEGTGRWDLMAYGSWNNSGACPAHINMYQKIQFGWVDPVVLSQPQEITGMPNSAMNPVAYRYNTSTAGEYFVMENRQQTGFDQYVPGKGLLIYRVSITNTDILWNTVNNKHPQKVYPVCASSNTNPTGTVSSYGNINSAGCPFPGTARKTSFTDYTIPSATSLISGANTFKPITEIQEQGATISFKFLMPGTEPVTNLTVTANNQNVKLSWTKPSDDVVSYNIYRNNSLLIKLLGKDNTSYTQINAGTGDYNYCVTAVYSGIESEPVCKEVKINSQIDGSYLSVLNLKSRNVNNDNDIELTWQSPFVSDWITHAGNLYGWCAYSTTTTRNQFVSTVRFTVGDLQKFQRSKLTKVRFSIRNTNCVYTVQIWQTDTDVKPSGNPIVNQLVNNPANPNDNFEVTLGSPVELAANKELWVGIKYELNPLTSIAGIDAGPMEPNRNYIFIDNEWYSVSEQDNFNFFIFGYLQFDTNLGKAPSDSWLRAANATATNYVVYRDGVKIATTSQPNYVDALPSFGPHIYCVGIAYNDGKESEAICIEAISLNKTPIIPINSSDEEINIYPNPVNKGDILTVHCNPNTVSTISLYTITGQLMQQEQTTEAVVYKKMNFEPGIYLLQIKNISKTVTRKIIIR